jgi:hypothetical protein
VRGSLIRRLAALAILAWLALSAPARADVYDDNPATASLGPGDMWVFARAPDATILERHLVNGSWTNWASIGGNTSSGPGAIAYDGQIRVYARGQDGAIWENVHYPGGWGGWASLGGYFTSAPAVAVRRGPLDYIDITARGGDNGIWFEAFVPGHGWSGWASRGGAFTSGPAVGSYADGALNIWARGTDGALKSMGWTGSAWTGWIDMGGIMTGAPAAVSRTVGVENVYARGLGNAIFQRAWTSTSTWSDWLLVDSRPVDSSPAAAGDGPSHEWLFARGGSGMLYKEWRGDTGWTAWSDFGPVAVPAPPPPPPPPPPADGEVSLQAGVRCTPPGGRVRVSLKVRHRKGKPKPRVQRIVFYTRGKGRAIRIDHKAPFVVHLKVNRPAGAGGRVYARVYYRRSKHGAVHRKTVSKRYSVCR